MYCEAVFLGQNSRKKEAMTISGHPEYKDECDHLSGTIAYLDSEIAQLYRPWQPSAASLKEESGVWKAKIERRDRLEEIREKLYTARIDWKPADKTESETFYIGVQELMARNVYSWAAPFASAIFYNGKPEGEKGVRLLKRIINIKNDKIEHFSDEAHPDRIKYVKGAHVVVETEESTALGDSYLVDLLAAPHSDHLSQIIATIQEQQFEAISAPLNSTLVIQGAPGTGKTIIALHRVAYLLYNHRSTLDRSRVRVFAPNPLFKSYVAKVLPELGERGIPQVTFDEWATALMKMEDRIEFEESAIEFILEPVTKRSHRALKMRNARSKGSLQMKGLLDAWVEHLKDERIAAVGDVIINAADLGIRSRRATLNWESRIPADRIRELLAPVLRNAENPMPLNDWGARALQIILYEANRLPEVAKLHESVEDEDRRSLSQSLERVTRESLANWETINSLRAYRRLLRSRTLMEEIGTPFFSQTELALLFLDAPRQGAPLPVSNLAALLYLNTRLNGIEATHQFDLAVVDEAQDLTPLQYLVLRQYSRTGAFTIVGDIAQGLYADNRLIAWQDLQQALGEVQMREFLQSYRSTDQITEYAHKLLRWTGTSNPSPAVALGRSGNAVVESAFVNERDRAERIARRAQLLSERGGRTAIIAKSAHACNAIAQELRQVGFADFRLVIKRDDAGVANTVLIPTYLAKGLEFDNVIVADADAASYQPNLLDARLLYVAVTRAATDLAVGWIGKRSSLLEPVNAPANYVPERNAELEDDPVTVAQFAATSHSADADTIVRRLAGSRDLDLLRRGTIDRNLLDLLMEQRHGSNEDAEEPIRLREDQVAKVVRYANVIEREESEASVMACALVQLAHGLLRNTLASNGIRRRTQGGSNEDEASFAEQVVELAELHFMTGQKDDFALGSFTSSARALAAVKQEHWGLANRMLNALRDRGVVEVIGSGSRERIRLAYLWVRPVLSHLLGAESAAAPDDDALADLAALPFDLTFANADAQGVEVAL